MPTRKQWENVTEGTRTDEPNLCRIVTQTDSSTQFYGALYSVLAHCLAVQPTTLLFWFKLPILIVSLLATAGSFMFVCFFFFF